MSPAANLCLRCGAPLEDPSLGRTCAKCQAALPRVGEPPRAEPTADEMLPASIGGHEITGILGSGGMGRVYLAKEPVLGREVALKVLKRGTLDVQAAEALLEEAVITGALAHPGIAPVYHVGKDEKFGLWYTMKPVEGTLLADILTGLREEVPAMVERYTIPALLAIFKSTCDAVAFAHHRGMVHRDLKPANVIIGEFGEVMVLDWGLVRILDKEKAAAQIRAARAAVLGPSTGNVTLPPTQSIVGTPGYMSPEQAKGQPAGPPSDVYALGAMLYQILTFRLPVDGRPQEMILRTAAGQIVPLEKRPKGRNAPRALRQIVMKALSLEPVNRYPDARALVREIDGYLGGRTAWAAREEGWQSVGGAWELQGGKLRCGAGIKAKAFQKGRLGGDVRWSGELAPQPGGAPVDASLWLAAPAPPAVGGYQFRVLTGDGARVELLRNGALVSRRLDVRLDPGAPHALVVSREDQRLRLFIDGSCVIDHLEIFPMRGDRVAVSSDSTGLSIAGVSVESRGAPLHLDFLALPDKVFEMGNLKEARLLYRDMAESHPDRTEGMLARYKAALCSIELGEAPEAQADLKMLEGSGFEALRVLAGARHKQREGKGKEMWGLLVAGLANRADPARLELIAMINQVLEQAERESRAAARDLWIQLIGVEGLSPQETAHAATELLRIARAEGGEEAARKEALGLLDAHKKRVDLRMECHAALARSGPAKDGVAAVRAQLQRTFDLVDQVTPADQARLIAWMVESHVATADFAGAESFLNAATPSVEHPGEAGLRLRATRALLAAIQGRWPDARKALDAHAADYAQGHTPFHFLSFLLAAVTTPEGPQPSRLALLAPVMSRFPDWKPLAKALTGEVPAVALDTWILPPGSRWPRGATRPGRS
ncbi:MAG: protein kinase [Planctomycetes bacterium]|nr:protein kinase [Planctomycetota bacterium]